MDGTGLVKGTLFDGEERQKLRWLTVETAAGKWNTYRQSSTIGRNDHRTFIERCCQRGPNVTTTRFQ